MTDLIESTLRVLSGQLGSRISKPGDDRYGTATAIWAKPIGPMPRTVVHCRFGSIGTAPASAVGA
jgi:hypothetical protein